MEGHRLSGGQERSLRAHPPQIVDTQIIRPLLRWAGSKRRQVTRLKLFWRSEHRRYVEPFAGSACLFFELDPPEAILGDKNAALIETYRVVRRNPKRIHWRLCH